MSTSPLLKPMTAGDILDQAIRIYRQNFVALVTIVALVSVPVLILQAAAIALVFPLSGDFTSAPLVDPSLGVGLFGIITFVLAIVGGFFAILQLGALTAFVSERFLGRAMTVREAYRTAFRRWLSLVVAAFLLGLVFVALFGIFFGIILVPAIGIAALGDGAGGAAAGLVTLCLCVLIIPAMLGLLFFYTRWVFWTQAIVIENYNSTGGLGRSWKLVKGSFWRVFGFILLLSIMVYVVTIGPTTALSFGAFFLPSPLLQFILQTMISGVIGVIVAPLQYATLTVLYYDLRIRREGFDLAMQMQDQTPSTDMPPLYSRSS